MKQDLVIGCYTGYNWQQIQYWVNSLNQSGFAGKKLMIVYNSPADPVEQLLKSGFDVITFDKNPTTNQFTYPYQFHIVVQRFFHMWEYLNSIDLSNYRYVITTDVRDVVFQSDPSGWLNTHMNLEREHVLVSGESLAYQHEPWGADNMQKSFPYYWRFIQHNQIWNCGVLAGKAEYMKDLFLNIWQLSQSSPIHNPDQAALNLLLSQKQWRTITRFASSDEGWAAQLGTTMDPVKIVNFRNHLLTSEPKFVNGEVRTTSDRFYPIVHQYDRVPELKAYFEAKYAG